MEPNFKVGDLVWAKMKSYSAWPARISEPDVQRKGQVYVYFFGPKPSYGWVPNNGVKSFEEHRDKFINASTKPDFKEAVKQIEEYMETMGVSGLSENEEANTGSDKDKDNLSSSAEPQKRKRQPKKKIDIEGLTASYTPSRASKRKASDLYGHTPKESKIHMLDSMRDHSNGTPGLDLDLLMDRPDQPVMDLGNTSELLKKKDITPSTYKFGFLGLGIMGMGIVKNLISSGHHVNLWSRNTDKCTAVKEQADQLNPGTVEVHQTPSDVMENSDIVFNCSQDPESAKSIVMENCGVIKTSSGTLDGKGYVEMTGIDPETSEMLAKEITNKGGRYLEAQLQGSKEEANDGSLILYAAGDKSLFDDCQSCFRAIGKSALYLGDVGVATKVYLIMQMMKGISLVGLAEGLVLADRCGISGKDIVNIFNMTNMSSPYLRSKAHMIINKDFKKVEHSIKNMQKDLRLALGLSDKVMQPLMMASATNEVFKHSRKLGYDEHDCACIYMKARY